MTPIQDPESWTRLSDRARWGLEHPDQSSPPRIPPDLTLRFRLWSYPSRGPHLSWGLFLPLWNDGQALVRESRWNAPSDRRRLSSRLATLKRRHLESPDLRLRDAVVDPDRLAPFLLQAPEILSTWAPAAPEDVAPADCGLEGYRSLTHVRLEWAHADEERAAGVVAWAVRLKRLLRSSLSERETA